ncbi:MAG: signal transduction histidine kinase [Marinoscillum sp.]|jgi:signal transduction histidine kinase
MKSVKSINAFKSVMLTIYDIITKGHNGEIKVESKEGEGTKFIISLPIH